MIRDLVQDAKTDKESMYLLIQQFEPLINKYSRLLKYEEAKTDIIIAFIEVIYKIPNLDSTPKIVRYISNSLKNTYIKLSKANKKKLTIVPLNEQIQYNKDESKAIFNIIDELSHIQKNIIKFKICGYSDSEIAKKLKK